MDLSTIDLSTLSPEVRKEVDAIIADYPEPAGKLMMILTRAQKIMGYLPPVLQLYIARRINIPAARVNGIVTFYSLFVEEPSGKYQISVCMGTACFVKGSGEVLKKFRSELKLKPGEKMTPDGLFSLDEVRCVGACGLAPVVRVNEKIYGHVSPEEVPEILASYRALEAQAAPVEEVQDA